MTKLNSLKISISSLISETNRLSGIFDSRTMPLIFYPEMSDVDIDHKTYRMHYDAVKQFTTDLELNEDTKIIKDKISELPVLSAKEFEYYKVGVPTIVLYILFPLGLYIWSSHYFKITALNDKLKDIARTLSTTHFMLKALTS